MEVNLHNVNSQPLYFCLPQTHDSARVLLAKPANAEYGEGELPIETS
jgi:hypothetical protein